MEQDDFFNYIIKSLKLFNEPKSKVEPFISNLPIKLNFKD